MPNPMGTDTGTYPACEWVELYNRGTTDINLQGWTLDDASWSHPIDANTWVDFANLATPYVLPAGGYAIIAENNQGTLKLNNAGEILDLIDSTEHRFILSLPGKPAVMSVKSQGVCQPMILSTQIPIHLEPQTRRYRNRSRICAK